MKIYATLTAAASLLGITSLAHAATLASSVVPTTTDTGAACYVRNVGPSPIVLQATISDSVGTPLSTSFQNCNDAPLAPGTTCIVRVDNTLSVNLACSAQATGSAKNLRGTLEIRDNLNNLKVLLADDLR